jgi:hypothetical protein
MQALIGKEVEVITYETVYRGTLIEVGERDVHIQSKSGWVIVPIDKIVDIVPI